MKTKSVAEIIAGQDIVTLSPKATVLEAVDRMHACSVGAVLILEDNKLVGIFTERDMIRLVANADFKAATTSLESVMTSNPGVAGPDISPADALWSMDSGGYRHLPIVEGDKVLGIVSRRDFF